MSESLAIDLVGEGVGDVAAAIVGQQSLRHDLTAPKPPQCTSEEYDRRDGLFVRKDLHVGQTGRIVDTDVRKLPADSRLTNPTVSVDAVTDPSDPPQLLRVQVEQLPRAILLVPDDRHRWIQLLESSQTKAAEHRTHGRDRKADPFGNRSSRETESSTELLDSPFDPGRGPPRAAVRPARAIPEPRLPFVSIPTKPSIDGAGTDRVGVDIPIFSGVARVTD